MFLLDKTRPRRLYPNAYGVVILQTAGRCMFPEQTLPPIPFTDADRAVLRADDVRAAKTIGGLASGIFLIGLGIYITVLLTTIATPPLYAIR